MTPAEQFAAWAEASSSIGMSPFIGTEPDIDGDVLTFYDTGGAADNADGNFETVTVMARVKSKDYAKGYELCRKLIRLLAWPTLRVEGSWIYTGVWLLNGPSRIERDAAGREIFTVNFTVMREPDTRGGLSSGGLWAGGVAWAGGVTWAEEFI